MCEACDTNSEIHTKILVANLNGRNDLGVLGLSGWIRLNLNSGIIV